MRRLTPLLALWILGTFALVRADEAVAPLRLEAEVKGRWLPVVGSKDNSLLVQQDDGRLLSADRAAKVRVAGELAGNLGFVRHPDFLRIEEVAQPSASREPRKWNAYAAATSNSLNEVQRKAAGNEASGWRLERPERVLAAALWLVDGRIAHLVVREVAGLHGAAVGVERASFQLTESELGGTAAFVAFMDGQALPVVPPFADPKVAKIAALASLGRDAEAGAIAAELTALPAAGRGEVSLLSISVGTGAATVVDRLLQLKAPVDVKGKGVQRPIDVAVSAGRLELVVRLLAAKSPTGPQTTGMDGPLHQAAGAGQLKICEALVAAGAKVDARGHLDETPLIHAINADRSEVALWLVGKGATFETRDDQSARVLISKAAAGQLPLVKLYHSKRVPVDFVWHGQSAIMAASREGHLDVVEYLLGEGVKADRSDTEGTTPLIAAAGRGRVAVVERLLAAKADPRRQSKRGFTPLLAACYAGSGPVVTRLLAAGADPLVAGPEHMSALTMALTAGSAEAVTGLLAHGAKVDPKDRFFEGDLQAALAMDSVEFVAAALAAGMPAERKLPGDWSLLQVARLMAAHKCVELLGAALPAAGASEEGRVVAMNKVEVGPRLAKLEPVRDPRQREEADFRGETVIVEAVIDEAGVPRFARATCQDCRLSRAAAETVALSKFTPAMVEGRAVATRVRLPIRFLDRSEVSFDASEVDEKPAPILTVPPMYPFEMKRRGIQGRVLLKFVVSPNGQVTDAVVVSSSNPEFETFALAAIVKWKFKPGIKDGVPVSTLMMIPIGFMLDNDDSDRILAR